MGQPPDRGPRRRRRKRPGFQRPAETMPPMRRDKRLAGPDGSRSESRPRYGSSFQLSLNGDASMDRNRADFLYTWGQSQPMKTRCLKFSLTTNYEGNFALPMGIPLHRSSEPEANLSF